MDEVGMHVAYKIVAKVRRRASAPMEGAGTMKLTNAMETAVKAHMTRIRHDFPDDQGVCWCPLCRADMMALALSALPPLYGTRRTLTISAGSDQDASVPDLKEFRRFDGSRFNESKIQNTEFRSQESEEDGLDSLAQILTC